MITLVVGLDGAPRVPNGDTVLHAGDELIVVMREEAEENACAGHAPTEVAPPVREQLRERISLLQTDLCSRCGICDTQCSQKLPVSWMFRAAYVALHPSETFETWNEVEYFRLQGVTVSRYAYRGNKIPSPWPPANPA